MKKLLLSLSIMAAITASAQNNTAITPATKGVVYGDAPTATGTPVNVNELQAKMSNAAFEGKVTGKVKEVCKAMGCWMKLEKSDGTTLMVKTKDHAYFMPQDILGKTVVIEGTAEVKEVSEEKRKHFAEDGGKTKEEIAKIKGAEKQVQFIAKSVQVVD